MSGATYDVGSATYKCLYDDEKIYLAMSIPGFYSFNADDNHKCAAIATMTKIGVDATFWNMGGCEAAMSEENCNAETVDACATHLVDVGAHWELSTTKQGVEYPIGLATDTNATAHVQSAQELLPTGDDAIANKDDEYAVSPYCRMDDDDENAGNEWAGAWKHTNPVDGEVGDYIFEMSRLLTTKSIKTDAQIKAGDTIEFGVAFWDPLEADGGWSDSGHYVTGCGTNWIELKLVDGEQPEGPTDGALSTSTFFLAVMSMVAALVVS